jgi:hypothetical protein
MKKDLDPHKRLYIGATRVMVLSLSCFQSRVTVGEERFMCHSCSSLLTVDQIRVQIDRGYRQRSDLGVL